MKVTDSGKREMLNKIKRLVAEAVESGIELDEITQALEVDEGYTLPSSQSRNVHGFMVRG
ncbi:hypothetical protein NIES4106_62470 (plasmid) [Fischerella sp. NIES-4106]|nr:hypothetical protein NIES4106_62470 [Fischerella sp. NIES-4106]